MRGSVLGYTQAVALLLVFALNLLTPRNQVIDMETNCEVCFNSMSAVSCSDQTRHKPSHTFRMKRFAGCFPIPIQYFANSSVSDNVHSRSFDELDTPLPNLSQL